jgi:hypothetical protein
MRALALVAALFVLAGCSTQAEQESSKINDALGRQKAAVDACVARIAQSDEYRALKDKLPPLDGSPPSMALQTDATTPTKEQSALLLAYHRDQLSPCRKVTVEGYAAAHPAFAVVMARTYAESDASFAQLVQAKITWGQFATESQQRVQASRGQIRQVRGQIQATLTDSHRYEVQQRQAAAAAFSQWNYQQQVLLQNQQMINAMGQPRMTNCQYVGTMLNCTSF